MTLLQHVFEPKRLFLTWQPPLSVDVRSRRVVAELVREAEVVTLRYLSSSQDFRDATSEGFKGFPAFSPVQDIHTAGVLDAFVRRLPPRKRDDYRVFLDRHFLPHDYKGSDFALLGLTGARLASDSFELFPDMTTATPPVDMLLEVAGFRHHASISDVALKEAVTFVPETGNSFDQRAIALHVKGKKIGYVSRPLCPSLLSLDMARLSGEVVRINGKPERPSVVVFLRYR